MKYSRYNIIFELSDRYGVLYNALSDKYLICGIQVLNDVSVLKSVDFFSKYSKIYNDLVDIGAIIKIEIDEIKLVKEAISECDNVEEIYQLIINPTLNCNFSCWYCYENHLKGSMMSGQTLEGVKNLIKNILESRKQIRQFKLSFFGGEPLLGYNHVVKPLVVFCENQCIAKKIEFSVNFTTNGYLINDNMILFFRKHGVDTLQITLDGYKETHDRIRHTTNDIGSYDKIIENIKKLIYNDISVVLRINYTTQNIDCVGNILHEFSEVPADIKDKLHINLQRVWQDNEDNSVEDKVYDCLQKCYEQNLSASKADFSSARNSCYADKKNQMLINYDGAVYKCTARDFTERNRMGELTSNGGIIWKSNAFEKWMNIKFSKETCLNCRIAPICCGGCRQKCLEREDIQGCNMGYSEEDKVAIVRDRFYTQFVLNS